MGIDLNNRIQVLAQCLGIPETAVQMRQATAHSYYQDMLEAKLVQLLRYTSLPQPIDRKLLPLPFSEDWEISGTNTVWPHDTEPPEWIREALEIWDK